MKSLFYKIKYLFFILLFINVLSLKADNYLLETLSEQNSELLIESNKQRSDLKHSIFYAEGNVIITNTKKEFVAKSKKAIFYQLSGKIKLIGNAQVVTNDSNKLKAGEIIYYLKENKFEANSDKNQRVVANLFLLKKKTLNQSSK